MAPPSRAHLRDDQSPRSRSQGRRHIVKLRTSSGMLAVAIAASVTIVAQPLRAEELDKTKKVSGTTVHYKVVLPNGYDPAKAYPAILALGGGPQTMNTVDSI